MAKKPEIFLDDEDDMATTWPMIDSYTTKDGLLVKVYKTAHAVMGGNKYSVRPKQAHI